MRQWDIHKLWVTRNFTLIVCRKREFDEKTFLNYFQRYQTVYHSVRTELRKGSIPGGRLSLGQLTELVKILWVYKGTSYAHVYIWMQGIMSSPSVPYAEQIFFLASGYLNPIIVFPRGGALYVVFTEKEQFTSTCTRNRRSQSVYDFDRDVDSLRRARLNEINRPLQLLFLPDGDHSSLTRISGMTNGPLRWLAPIWT